MSCTWLVMKNYRFICIFGSCFERLCIKHRLIFLHNISMEHRPLNALIQNFYQNCPAVHQLTGNTQPPQKDRIRCLLYPAVTGEQTSKERNLLYLAISVLRIWQHHFAIKSGVGEIVIPILPIFFQCKPMPMGKNQSMFSTQPKFILTVNILYNLLGYSIL